MHTVDSFVHQVRRVVRFSCQHLVTNAVPAVPHVLPLWLGGKSSKEDRTQQKKGSCPKQVQAAMRVLPCYLCGRKSQSGVDRVDSRAGYEADNVQPCC